jgi:tetratricopeptide (TPR) repeat protein
VSGGELGRDRIPDGATPPPLPPMVASIRGLPFTGRADALAALDESWASAGRGPARLVLVTGEPGVGKTRLAVEFARRLHARGAAVLAGSCAPEPVGSYQPIREALQQYVAGVGADAITATLPERVPLLARLVPDLGPPPPSIAGDPELYRLALFDAVVAVLARAGANRAALLIVDDIQWADASSVACIRHVLRTVQPQRLLVLGTARLHEVGPDHPLSEATASLLSANQLDRLDLDGLGADAIREVLETRVAGALGPDMDRLATQLHRTTDGNPLFLGQLLRHLQETGRLRREEDRWVLEGDPTELRLPAEVHEVVGRRLSGLSPDCQTLMRSAAVLGRVFDLRTLGEVAAMDPDRVLELVEEAMRWRVVGEVADTPGAVDWFFFAHDLLRQTLYDGMSATRRQRIHQRAAAAMAEAGADAIDVANHLLAAAVAAPPDRVCAAVVAAGREAIGRTAYETAVSMCTRALATFSDRIRDADRRALIAIRAEARLFLGLVREARDDVVAAAELAAEAGDWERMAEVLTAWCRTAPLMLPDRRLLELCAQALAGLAPESVARGRLLGATCHQLVYAEPLPVIERRAIEAYATGRRLGDAEAVSHAATAYRLVADHRPLAERRQDILDAIVDGAGEGSRPGRLVVLQHSFIHAFESGDRRAFDAALAEYRDLADALDYPVGRATSRRAEAALAICEGRLQEAEALAAEALELTPYALVSYTALLFVLYRELDRLGELAPAIPDFLAQFPDTVAWRLASLAVDQELGQRETAERGVRELAGNGFSAVEGALAMRAVVAMLAELATEIGDPAIAGSVFERVAGWTGQNLAIEEFVCLGASDRYLGQLETVLGELDRAVDRLERAIDFDEAFGSNLWAAYGRLALAGALERRGTTGDAERADRLLDEVAATAEKTGSVRLARLVAETAVTTDPTTDPTNDPTTDSRQ